MGESRGLQRGRIRDGRGAGRVTGDITHTWTLALTLALAIWLTKIPELPGVTLLDITLPTVMDMRCFVVLS